MCGTVTVMANWIDNYDAVIIGASFAGFAAAIQLRERIRLFPPAHLELGR